MIYTLLKDQLGFERTWNNNEWAQDAASTAIPANESIVVMNWAQHKLGATVASQHYVGVGPVESVGGERVSILRQGDVLYCGAYGAAWQQIEVAIPDDDMHLYTIVVDRDNTLLDIWLDDKLLSSTALTQDPDLTANNQLQLNNSTAGAYNDIHFKGAVFSLTNAATPTQAQMAIILRHMMNPDAAIHSTLSSAIGTHDAMWLFGEGDANATTIENDQNPGTDDLAIQGGLDIADTRARLQSPRRNTRRTFYSLTPGYTATTGNQDFGFFTIPVIFRVLFDGMGIGSNYQGAELTNAAGTHYIRIENASNVLRISVRTGGAVKPHVLSADMAANGADIIVVCTSTDCYICANGPLIDELTLTATLNLSGNCQVNLNGRAKIGLVQAYNEVLPGGFAGICDALCCTTQNPERRILGMSVPLVDFPIRSDLIAAGGTTVANQGNGGGTLTLSAQRTNSCQEVRTGYDP
jgi:hypothetical protein